MQKKCFQQVENIFSNLRKFFTMYSWNARFARIPLVGNVESYAKKITQMFYMGRTQMYLEQKNTQMFYMGRTPTQRLMQKNQVCEVYGDPRGSQGVVYMRFEKCMGTMGVIAGRLCQVWEVFGRCWCPRRNLVIIGLKKVSPQIVKYYYKD